MSDSFDADDKFWDDVLDRVDRFSCAWETEAKTPDLDAFLPAAGCDTRPVTLVELIKIDLEHRYQRGDASMSVAKYAERYPELTEPDGVPVDLLYEELHIRQQHDNTVSIAEYARDFPKQAPDLRRLMNVDHPLESTTARGTAASIDVEVGETLGDFELLSELGSGAFARVFLARQQSMQRLVAVKVSADRGSEPQTLAQLDHPHIVRVYDQRKLDDRQLRLLYMQYVPGGTLQEVLARVKTFPRHLWSGKTLLHCLDFVLEERGIEPPHDSRQRATVESLDWCDTVCLIGQQLAEALHYAHGRSILHRDIKPANTLMSESASPKLVDFNISFCSKFEGSSASAYFGGSLAYMSPEQLSACNPSSEAEAAELDGRSDVYSLGIVLWEMLVGRRPFDDSPPNGNWSSTLDELTRSRQAGVAADQWSSLPDNVSAPAKTVLKRCLHPDRQKRFGSAAIVADQLKLARTPEVFDLLGPPKTWFHKCVAAAPELVMVITVVVPNAIASALNYGFNRKNLASLEQPGALWHYDICMLAFNLIAFPIGVVWGVWLMRGVAKEVRSRLRSSHHPPALTTTRHRCLRLGRYLALVGICEWTVAGIIFPIVMKLLGTPLNIKESFLYPMGLLAAGAWGSVIPFFLGTKMLLEVWYPALLRPRAVGTEDVPALVWLENIMRRYLFLPAAIPLVSLFVIVCFPSGGEIEKRHIAVLSIGGVVLGALAFAFAKKLQRQLHLLQASVDTD